MRSSGALSRILNFLCLVGFFLFALQACVHVPSRKGVPCKGDPGVYRRALSKLAETYKGLSGTVKVRVESKEGKVSFTGDLYAASPDKLHLDVFGFLHRPRFVLIKSGETIAWRDFDSGRSYVGPLARCPGFPANFPVSPLFLRDFIRILFLNFPGPLAVRAPEGTDDPCRFTLTCRWGSFEVTMDPGVALPVLVVGPKGEKFPFRLTFSDYAEVSSLVVPRRYGISVRDVHMTFDFRTLKVNPAFPPGVFVPRLPR